MAPVQPQLPGKGVNWDKIDKDGRKAIVEKRYSQGPSQVESAFRGSGSGDTQTPIDHAMHYTSRSRSTPSQQAVNALALSDIPAEDLRRGATSLSSGTRYGTFSRIDANTLGSRNVQTGNIRYDREMSVPTLRSVLTHELAHSLQSDLPKSTLEVELDKTKRELSNQHASINSRLRRYSRPTSVDPQLSSVPWVSAQTAISEGSAEGFRKRYEGSSATPPNISYSPDFFKEKYHHEGTSFGENAAEAYAESERFTQETGRVVPDSLSHTATKYAGVLADDLAPTGTRQNAHDIATSHRMASYLLHVSKGGDPKTHPHAGEFFMRQKAIEGERVQGSLLPDLVPETDQFGQAVTGTPARSPRGQALAEGRPTERPHSLTLDAEARRQQVIVKQRQADRWSAPLNPGVSKYHDRLQNAARDKQERDARENEKQKRVESNELHPAVSSWLDKLVYAKKKDYAKEYALARQSGSALPEPPAGLKEEHAEKARNSVDKLFEKHKIG
jgi:hypothetical protein